MEKEDKGRDALIDSCKYRDQRCAEGPRNVLGFTPLHSVGRQLAKLYPTEPCGDPSMRKTAVTTTHKIAPNYSGVAAGQCKATADSQIQKNTQLPILQVHGNKSLVYQGNCRLTDT